MSLMQPPERPDLLDRHSTDLVVVVDELGRLAWMSPSVTRLLGYPAAELLGTQVITLIHADEQDRASRALAEMSSDQVSTDAYRVRHHDGSWRHLRLTGQCEPEGSGVVVALHDVTEQLQREAELPGACAPRTCCGESRLASSIWPPTSWSRPSVKPWPTSLASAPPTGLGW